MKRNLRSRRRGPKKPFHRIERADVKENQRHIPPPWSMKQPKHKQQEERKQVLPKKQQQPHKQPNKLQHKQQQEPKKLQQQQHMKKNLQPKQQQQHVQNIKPQQNEKNVALKKKQDELYNDSYDNDDDDDDNDDADENENNDDDDVVDDEEENEIANKNNNIKENNNKFPAHGNNKVNINKEDDNDDDDEDENNEYNDDYYDDFVDSLNNTKRAEIDLVFFNRCAKVGSQSLMELIDRLAKRHHYVHSKNVPRPRQRVYLPPVEQKTLIKEIIGKPKPGVYSEHINYINFTQFHMPRPIYINMIRDPLERIRSWFYYVRAEWYYVDMRRNLGDKTPPHPPKEFMEMDFDTCVKTGDPHCQYTQMDYKDGDYRRQTMFFCGQNRKFCMPFNSKAAMQKAKRTVEEDYAVVGTWEETNVTLAVLEHYIPRYFADATKVYYEGKARLSVVNKNNVTRPMTDETRLLLRQNFTHEIEFYEFCKQRLFLQYSSISQNSDKDDDGNSPISYASNDDDDWEDDREN